MRALLRSNSSKLFCICESLSFNSSRLRGNYLSKSAFVRIVRSVYASISATF